jgi:aryl-alcohol dehydrogenase-like predicted oxidoreductase
MQYRPLGNTGITVSEIGVGCGGIGEGCLTADVVQPALEYAFEQGVTFFDTAEGYGCGESERALGRLFSGRRDQVVIASKFGGVQLSPGSWSKDFSAARLEEALDASLRRLETDYIDVYQLHTPKEAALSDCALFEKLDRAVEQGKIRCYGLSNDDGAQAGRFLDRTRGRTIQLTFNLFSQKDRQEFVIGQAPKRRIGLICKVPLSGGLLSGRFSDRYPPPDDERRARWGEESYSERLTLVERVRPVLEAPGRSMAQGALAWLLSHESVSTVIPGVSSLEKMSDNLAAAGMRLTPDDMTALDAIPELADIHLGW